MNSNEKQSKELALDQHLELNEHWKGVIKPLDKAYEEEVGDIIKCIESIRTSDQYLYRGENRDFEFVSSSMYRMTKPLFELLKHTPNSVSQRKTITFSNTEDKNQRKSYMILRTMDLNEYDKHGVLPIHRNELLENPSLLMELLEKEFKLEFESRSSRIYDLGDSDAQSEIQHHLGKTRYVDMTRSIYIALFFACYGGGDCDGRIIFLNDVELESYGQLEYPKRIDNSRFKNQDSVLFLPNNGYIKPQSENILIIPKHLKIPILLWLNKNKEISSRTIYNDTLGLIENQKALEVYYEKYTRLHMELLNSTANESLETLEKIIVKINNILNLVPIVIDMTNPNYNFVKMDEMGNPSSLSIDKDTITSIFFPSPFSLYFHRTFTRICIFQHRNRGSEIGQPNTDEIEQALDDLSYARYLVQFTPGCVSFCNDRICIYEGILYMYAGEIKKAKQKFIEALEIHEELNDLIKDQKVKEEIMFYLKQFEEYGL